MRIYAVLFLLVPIGLFAQDKIGTMDLPPNPKAGHCYVRCLSDSKKKAAWEDVNCALLYMQKIDLAFDEVGGTLSKKDKRLLEKKFKKLIKKGAFIQIESHYNQGRSTGQNSAIAKGKSVLVADYLINLGLNPDFLRVSVEGSNKNKTEMNYRIINSHSGFQYDEKKGFWCKSKTEK